MPERFSRERRDRFNLMFEAAPVGMAFVAAAGPSVGRFLEVNRELADLFGYSADSMARMSMHDVTHPDDASLTADAFAQLASGDLERVAVETPYVRRDGTMFWGSTFASLLPGHAGRPPHAVVHVGDITDRKRAELKLLRRAAQLAESQRQANIGSFEIRLASGEVTWSEQTYRILGFDSDAPPLSVEEFETRIHPEDRRYSQPIDEKLRHPQVTEYRFVRGDGRTIVLRVTTVPTADEPGRPIGVVGTVQDMTPRRRMEAAVQAAERLETAFEAAPVALLLARFDGRPGAIVHANRAVAELTGRGAADIVGRPLAELFAEVVLPSGLTHLAPGPANVLDERASVRHPDRGLVVVRARGHLVAMPATGQRLLQLALQEEVAPAGSPDRGADLTLREREILALVAGGAGGAEIAAHLHLSAETVKTHLRRIYLKFGVSDRAAAVAVALRRGIID